MHVTSSRPSVLIVDDDEDFLELMATYLGDEGFDVRRASDGIDALSCLYGRRPPRLVLIDLKMPRMDGLELIVQIRSDRALAAVTVIAMSGDRELLRRAQEVGASDIMTKPLRMDLILSTLRRLSERPPALPRAMPERGE